MALSTALLMIVAAQAAAGYTLGNLPDTWQDGQEGYNDCGTGSDQSTVVEDLPATGSMLIGSMAGVVKGLCQTAVINSLTDFCLWGPPSGSQEIGNSERYEVAWCTQSGHGTRLIPEGTIKGAHFVETPHYVQVTGVGDFTKMNIQAGDAGGELDPHGADGNGNPVGGLVFSNEVQIKEWTSFISADEFCFRACKSADDAWLYCQHIYDLQGCMWNEPGDYSEGFDTCEGDSTEYPGIYVSDGKTSTYAQGDGNAPAAHTEGATSQCKTISTIPYGVTYTSGVSNSTHTSTILNSTRPASFTASSSGNASVSASTNATVSASVTSSVALSASATNATLSASMASATNTTLPASTTNSSLISTSSFSTGISTSTYSLNSTSTVPTSIANLTSSILSDSSATLSSDASTSSTSTSSSVSTTTSTSTTTTTATEEPTDTTTPVTDSTSVITTSVSAVTVSSFASATVIISSQAAAAAGSSTSTSGASSVSVYASAGLVLLTLAFLHL